MSTGALADVAALADQLIAPASPSELDARIAALAPGLDLALVAELKARVDATKLRNARRALEIASVAVAVAESVGEPAAVGLALWARGNALYHLSHFGEALDSYRRAAAFYTNPEHALELARLQINQVAVLQDLGAFDEALATAALARAVCERIGAPARRFLALLEMNSGAAFQQLARPDEALAAYERGEAIFVDLGEGVETARMQINRANVLQELGRFATAEQLYRGARAALAAAGADQEVARAEHNLGKLAYRRGRYQEALALLEAARAGYAAIPNPLEVAKAELYRALVFRDLGMLDEAAELAATAGRAFARARTRWEEAIALTVEGTCLGRLGAPEQAAPLLQRARRLFRRQGAVGRLPPLDADRAALALAAGDPAQAARLASRVARATDPDGWPALAARARVTLSAAQLAAGRPARATRLAGEACALAARYNLPEAAAAHHALALAREARGDGPAAWAALANAVAAAEELRASLPLDDLRLAFLDSNQPIYRDAARMALQAREPAVALAAISLALSAPLPRPTTPTGDPAMRAELAGLREEWAYLQSALDEPASGPAAPDLAELDRRRRALELRIADLTRSLALRDDRRPLGDEGRPTTDDRRPTTDDRLQLGDDQRPTTDDRRALGDDRQLSNGAHEDSEAGGAAARPSRASGPSWSRLGGASLFETGLDGAGAEAALAALQARLGPGEALLVYAAAGDELFVLAITPTSLVRRSLPVGVAAVARLLRAWRFHIDHAYGAAAAPAALASARAILARLHDAMVAPLAALLGGGARLVVALPPEWHDLPLAAALGPDGHLIEGRAVSFVSAPGALGPPAPPTPSGAALVVGCSDGGRLPDAPREAEAVAAVLAARRPVRLLVEAEATRAAVAAALPEYAIIHLAAHAVYRPDNPRFSWARLADGHLAVADLEELSLRQRPLVVLSACETGRGSPRGGGLVGMARGFMLAGAQGLVASLWKIADSSTARLMGDFYAELGAAGPAAALATAQRRAAARGEHPFHWAAFVCIEG